jgi:hypothetical protein
MTRRAPQLAVACLLATACANSNHHATRPPRTHVQPLAAPITVTAQTPAATPAAVRRRGGVNGSPAAACSVVVRFADAYPRYLTATLAARRLPRLAPSGLATVAQTGRLPTRLRHLQLRAVGIEQHGTSWMIRYITSIAGHRATLSSRVTLTRTPDGWQIAQITPPDLDQLIAQHPPSTPVPTLVRVAAVAFTRSYLAYTYAHGPAAALTHLTRPLRARLASTPPTVPAGVRVLDPRATSIAFAPVAGGRWLAIADVIDGVAGYQLQSTLVPTPRGWLVIRVSAVG